MGEEAEKSEQFPYDPVGIINHFELILRIVRNC